MTGTETTTSVSFVVYCIDAQGKLTSHDIPMNQAPTPERAEETVRTFCRPSDQWPLTAVECVGVRNTVTTMKLDVADEWFKAALMVKASSK